MMNIGGVVFALRSRKRTEIKGLAEYVCNDVNEKNSIPKGAQLFLIIRCSIDYSSTTSIFFKQTITVGNVMTKQMLGYDVNLPYGHYHQKKKRCVRARFSYLLRLRDFYSILCVL